MHRHRAPFLPGAPRPATGRPVASVVEFEELSPFVADGTVTDVLVLGGRGVWVDRGDGVVAVPGLVLDEERTRGLARALVALGGRHVDETTPCADVRLGDGIRVHAVLAPVSTTGTAISVRVPRAERPTVDGLAADGFFTDVPRAVVDVAVASRWNVLVTGATGSGKTTLLAAMLALVPHDERIVSVEDVAELRVDHPHVVALEARQANAEGTGALGLERLLREALRMRPDRLVVGECRGAEVRDLMSALNTGHDGGAGTVHANGVADVPARLEALGALAGLGADALARQATSAFDLVLHVERRRTGRRLAGIGRLGIDESGRLEVRPVDPGEIVRPVRDTGRRRASRPRTAATRGAEPRTSEPRTVEPRTAEPRAVEPRTTGARSPEFRTAGVRSPEFRTARVRSAERRSAEPRTLASHAAGTSALRPHGDGRGPRGDGRGPLGPAVDTRPDPWPE